ncbi:Hypothetical protein PHPALM_10535 [Phytophthora palmivora]|uniref:Uncharacterized protein n=1 Tax=Phytophthora palmivora TaxID=4796 RepID=A0A2P4Y4H4_9STRA|nr:Hypothetical protein PHPALM_10535 [Phytophthora palmivora]
MHHSIVIATNIEHLILKAKQEGWIIGAIITDDGGQCGMVRRIWHHGGLKSLSRDFSPAMSIIMSTGFKVNILVAAVINAINASSAKWFGHLSDLQKQVYGKKRVLILLCLTRWNSMLDYFASLLRSKRALAILKVQHGSSDCWPSSLKLLDNQKFGSAPFRLQREENTLTDVVVSRSQIYRKFATYDRYGNALIECVERRWENCE